MKKILTLLVFFATISIFALLSFGLDMHVVFSGMFAGSVSWLVAYLFYENVKGKTFKNPFKRFWFWLRYKRVKEVNFCSCRGCVFLIAGSYCGIDYSDYCFDKSTIFAKRSYKPLNWLKKLFAFIIIALIISSCVTVNVYQNEKTKVKEYKKEAQKLEQLESAWY